MKSKNIAIMIGGVAAGMLGGRLIPPLAAALIGSQQVRAGGDPFSLLIDDHREIRTLLNQMMAAGTRSMPKQARLFLMLKRRLAKHAMAEEDVVYPIVRNDSAGGDQRKHLYEEHADMKMLLHEIEEDFKSRQDWTVNVTALRNLVLNHIEEEEKTVFPELRRELSEARRPKLASQISREEAVVI